ncbi:hypothetical protein DIE03_25935 [Burkholderia sp. Bp8992]|uniref:hypothetical protein n=1 Tax=Burkholderia sp. Bp8992 TaxID=2184554 RepID=UPI000F589696|nr:hypothetical protein [Burkholderia sp. Bp8992]RQS25249.1 hypothetical protein DIE03_25935 [Burkholderia sp. Bp8992]
MTDKLDLTPGEMRKLDVCPDFVRTMFHNGGGDYQCVDLRNGDASGWIWWHARPTELERAELWAVMNAWFDIFVEGADER